MKDSVSILTAFVGGAILGAAVALLLAPSSGETARLNVREFIDSEIGKCKDKLNAECSAVKSSTDCNE